MFLMEEKYLLTKEITCIPLLKAPPNRIRIESDTPVESRMKTALTFTFSPKTNHG